MSESAASERSVAFTDSRGQVRVRGATSILYVGKTGDLQKRLREHLNNPPVAGITHVFAEAIGTDAARTQREYVLIQEFKPVGNTLLK